MEGFYRLCGISRQGFMQGRERLVATEKVMKAIEKEVSVYRSNKDRRAGSRSLYYNLSIGLRYGIGVNKFERLMSRYGLTLVPMRVRVVTTHSSSQSWNYSNLAEGLVIDGINQLVVGDLTYIYMGTDLYYLFVLTDVYSSRIVGYHLGKRMRKEEACLAQQQWLDLRSIEQLEGCIHHTDGGGQYLSKVYREQMEGVRVSISKNCLDNGFAEQRNGLLKHHLLPTMKNGNLNHLLKSIGEIMYFYNHERKQENLGWLTPVGYEKFCSEQTEPPKMRIYHRSKRIKTTRG